MFNQNDTEGNSQIFVLSKEQNNTHVVTSKQDRIELYTSYVYAIDTVIIGSMKTMFIVVASPCLGTIYE